MSSRKLRLPRSCASTKGQRRDRPQLVAVAVVFLLAPAVLLATIMLARMRSAGPAPQQGQQATAMMLATKKASMPVLPLPFCVKYSHRPTEHLQLENRTIETPFLPPLQMAYLKGSKQHLRNTESLYSFDNYLSHFEGSVTHTWMAILSQSDARTSMVIDGGMNTGFYTTLSAVMGFRVHAFDIQLDCFDVAQLLLTGNGVSIAGGGGGSSGSSGGGQRRASSSSSSSSSSSPVQATTSLYHLGLWREVGTMERSTEGCDPGKAVMMNSAGGAAASKHTVQSSSSSSSSSWLRRSHDITTVPLDLVLDSHPEQEEVALLKLDVEGAEIPALQGLVRHLMRVRNIIMEFSPSFSSNLGSSTEDAIAQFQRLQQSGGGMVAIMLFLPSLINFTDVVYLKERGVMTLTHHPVLKTRIDYTPLSTNTRTRTNGLMWQIVDWDAFLNRQTGACRIACNIWFTRVVATTTN
jgi:Methyltransferase FkbM domain